MISIATVDLVLGLAFALRPFPSNHVYFQTEEVGSWHVRISCFDSPLRDQIQPAPQQKGSNVTDGTELNHLLKHTNASPDRQMLDVKTANLKE